jgi:hypothetical protein
MVVVLTCAVMLLVPVAQGAVYQGAVTAFAPPPRFWYASLLLVAGGLGVLLNIAAAESRWWSAARRDAADGTVAPVSPATSGSAT